MPQSRLPANSVVNLTVDTHCKIWQIVENEPSGSHADRKSPLHRIHSVDDVLNKDNDFILNYFKDSNSHAAKESSPVTTDEGFHSNDSHNVTSNNNNNKKKLLFSSHAQFSRDYSLDDGVEENIVLSEVKPLKDAAESNGLQLPSLKNEVYVKICSSGSVGSDVDKNGSN